MSAWVSLLRKGRVALGLFVGTLVVGHVLAPTIVHVDAQATWLILILATLTLAPLLASAKLPGGAEFKFRQKIEAAEHISADVRTRLYKEGYTGSRPAWPTFLKLDERIYDDAINRPQSALAEVRRRLADALRGAARAVARDRMPPEEVPALLDFLAVSDRVWPEQVALMRVMWDVANASLLRGETRAEDALRVLAVAETLNDSFALGYSLNFEANEEWRDQGLICQYEHCIENMPLPRGTRQDAIEYRNRISSALAEGFYDSFPERKREFEAMLAEPVPDDLPEHEDRSGACPTFGHYCPGGAETVKRCEPARQWESDAQDAALE